jgi:hypothetical protein
VIGFLKLENIFCSLEFLCTFSHFILLFHFFSFQHYAAQRYTAASVVSLGSPPKKQFSSADANAASVFGRAKFSAHTSNVNRAAYLEK